MSEYLLQSHKQQTMKKSILVALLALMSCISVYAREYCDTIVRKDYTQTQYVDAVKRWVVANEDTYRLRIAYANNETGKFIVKGVYQEKGPLTVVWWRVAVPYVSFVLNISCTDSSCIARVAEAKLSFDYLEHVDYRDMPKKYLNECIRELEILSKYSHRYDPPFNCLDEMYTTRWLELREERQTAENTAKDENATKKERKDAEKFVKNYAKSGRQAEECVCYTIGFAALDVKIYLVSDVDTPKALKTIIKNDF